MNENSGHMPMDIDKKENENNNQYNNNQYDNNQYDNNNEDIVMFMIIDESLSRGRSIAQSSHCMMVYMNYIKDKEKDCENGIIQIDDELIKFLQWRNSCTKIIKKASKQILLDMVSSDTYNQLVPFYDNGELLCIITKPDIRSVYDKLRELKLY
jgi:hypothetical protein